MSDREYSDTPLNNRIDAIKKLVAENDSAVRSALRKLSDQIDSVRKLAEENDSAIRSEMRITDIETPTIMSCVSGLNNLEQRWATFIDDFYASSPQDEATTYNSGEGSIDLNDSSKEVERFRAENRKLKIVMDSSCLEIKATESIIDTYDPEEGSLHSKVFQVVGRQEEQINLHKIEVKEIIERYSKVLECRNAEIDRQWLSLKERQDIIDMQKDELNKVKKGDEKDKEAILKQAECDGLGSQLLEIQQECIKQKKDLAQYKKMEKKIRDIQQLCDVDGTEYHHIKQFLSTLDTKEKLCTDNSRYFETSFKMGS